VNGYIPGAPERRIGPRAVPAAVVDIDYHTTGYEHLRICDAPLMPDAPKANTHLTNTHLTNTHLTSVMDS
jgi:choline dehydrogenase-like flavoprotein